MKIRIIVMMVLLTTALSGLKAQHVSVRLSFPAGVHTRAVGRTPYKGAIWIGPEWQWRGGRYVSVPGYWVKPGRYGAVWVPGHWQHSRRGYRWVPGHWR